jgi:hypothetical protein
MLHVFEKVCGLLREKPIELQNENVVFEYSRELAALLLLKCESMDRA